MRVDRLSKLPDEILIKILSDLPTKCSVRTSVLSQRWKSLWSHVPTLDLDYHDFLYVDDYDEEVFTGLISSFLKSNQDLDLDTFKLAYHVYAHHNDVFEGWINVAIKRRIRHLNVVNESESEEIVRMPLSLYQCKTLVSLSLHHLHLDDDDDNTSFSLPCLERMHLEMIKFAGDLTLENLITSCESLRELTIIRDQDDMLEAINVYSKSLDRFVLNYVAYESLYPMQSVEIDAPRLEYLSLTDHLSERIIVSSIAPFFKVYVDVNFGVEYEYDESLDITDASKTTMIGEFLTAISNVSDIFFSATTLKVLYDYCSVQPLPQFTKLHRLHTLFFESSLEFLPILLESCPNLRSLVLEFHQRSVVTKTKPIKLSTVPQCFQSSLEFVQIMAADTSSKLELATYFLRNCVVLKKLKLSKSFRPILPKIRRILRKHTRIEC